MWTFTRIVFFHDFLPGLGLLATYLASQDVEVCVRSSFGKWAASFRTTWFLSIRRWLFEFGWNFPGFLWFEFQSSCIDLEQTLQPFFHLDLIIDLSLSLHEGLAVL